MKKILSLILAIALCLTAVFCISFSASATETNRVALKVRCYTEGETKKIETTVSTNFAAAGLQGKIAFSDNGTAKTNYQDLEYLGIENTVVRQDAKHTDNFQIFEDKASINYGIFGDLTSGSQGDWVTAKFEWVADGGKTTFSIVDSVAADTKGAKIDAVCDTNVEVNMVWQTGDATGDSIVNIVDLVRLDSVVNGTDTANVYYQDNCNVDADDADVNNADFEALRQLLLAQ